MIRVHSRAPSLAAALAVSILALGCGKKESTDDALGAIVARVNGQPIREAETTREVQHLLSMMGQAGANAQADPTAAAQVRSRAIDNLIDRQLLLERARAEEIAPTDEEVTGELGKVKAQFASPDSFLARIRQFQMTEGDVTNEIRINLCLSRLAEKLAAALPAATADDAAKYYADHPEEFASPEQIRASHILIRSAETDSAAARAQARQKVEGVLAELRAGRDFTEAAKEHSQDPGSAPNGGDVGFFARGRMVPQFEAAAFSLEIGKLSGIVETPYGFHILKVTEKRAARVIPIDEVRDQIVQFLDQQKGSRAIQTAIQDSRGKAKIEKPTGESKG